MRPRFLFGSSGALLIGMTGQRRNGHQVSATDTAGALAHGAEYRLCAVDATALFDCLHVQREGGSAVPLIHLDALQTFVSRWDRSDGLPDAARAMAGFALVK
jgi:hypothetical protein